jgi:peptide/nickel transport system permease protein
MKKSITRILFVRLFSSMFILFLLISTIFILLRIAPGDPVQKFISPELSNQLAEKVRESFHLNGSIVDQYLSFVKNLFLGNFGISYNYHSPVLSVISDYLLFTLIFSLICFAVQLITSYLMALTAYKNKNRFWWFV